MAGMYHRVWGTPLEKKWYSVRDHALKKRWVGNSVARGKGTRSSEVGFGVIRIICNGASDTRSPRLRSKQTSAEADPRALGLRIE